MRLPTALPQLIEGDDGKLDEQAVLSIFLGVTLGGLEIFNVVWRGQAFDPMGFAGACAEFMGASLGALTLRSRFARGVNNAGVPDQPNQ
jgi:hypothetical protein